MDVGKTIISGPGFRWVKSCIGMWSTSLYLDRYEMGPTWSRGAIFGAWMKVRRLLGGGETRISGSVLRWDVTCIVVICESSDLDGGDTLHGGATRLLGPGSSQGRTWVELRRTSLGLYWLVIGPEWDWNAMLRIRNYFIRQLDGVRCNYLDMGWSEMGPGWSLNVNLWALGEIQDVVGGDIHISTWIRVRWDLHAGGLHIFRAGWGVTRFG